MLLIEENPDLNGKIFVTCLNDQELNKIYDRFNNTNRIVSVFDEERKLDIDINLIEEKIYGDTGLWKILGLFGEDIPLIYPSEFYGDGNIEESKDDENVEQKDVEDKKQGVEHQDVDKNEEKEDVDKDQKDDEESKDEENKDENVGQKVVEDKNQGVEHQDEVGKDSSDEDSQKDKQKNKGNEKIEVLKLKTKS